MTECTYNVECKLNKDSDELITLAVDNTRVVIKTIYGTATLSHEDFKEVYKKFEVILKQVEPLLGVQE